MTLTNGLVVMTPSSIAKTGASSTATINADGSVTFGSCETLSLNGVFTGDYDNYMVKIRHYSNAGSLFLQLRLRASGADASGADYTYQFLNASGTSVTGMRYSSLTNAFVGYSINGYGGDVCYLFGPYLAQPTAGRTVNVNSDSNARINDLAWIHSLSTSYDGMTIGRFDGYLSSGLLTVFGFNQ